MHLRRLFLFLAIIPAVLGVDPGALRQTSESYLAKRPAAALPSGITFDEAVHAQRDYVNLLMPTLGPVVGYKIGFVTAAAQQHYGLNHPTRGVLLRDMLLPDRSRVSVNYGARPILEPDLMVRVKDNGINQAKTVEEAARHLTEIMAFIELADATFATNVTVDAGMVTSANVGARSGILGESRPMEAAPNFLEAFGKMQVILKDGSGNELSRVSAEGMMGHPLNPLLWFILDQNKRGEKLKAGDLISLGSPSPPVAPPQARVTYTLLYEGLPGGPLTSSVTFE